MVLIHVSYYIGQQQASQETDGQKAKSYTTRGFLSECKTRSIRAIRNDRQLSHKKVEKQLFYPGMQNWVMLISPSSPKKILSGRSVQF